MYEGVQKMYHSFANTLVYEGVISGNDILDRIEEISDSGVRPRSK